MTERESVKVLVECVELQKKKSQDYQNPNSTVRQADYYPNGVMTIHDILHAKMLRARSLLESREAPQNEALEDTYKDLINYASFAVAWLRGGIPGQGNVDAYNRPKDSVPVTDGTTFLTGVSVQVDTSVLPQNAEPAVEQAPEVPTVQSQRQRATAPRVPSTSSANMYR